MSFEEEYEDVLQNIEAGIISVYREDKSLMDYDVMDAMEALIRQYAAEQSGREARPSRLHERAQHVFDAARSMCEMTLGRENQAALPIEPITIEEVIKCLKRIQTSVRRWNKQGGRQGYLNFVIEFIP